jgi:hypothetical protein
MIPTASYEVVKALLLYNYKEENHNIYNKAKQKLRSCNLQPTFHIIATSSDTGNQLILK